MSGNVTQGNVVKGKVIDIKKFGAFVELEGGKQGFIHISKVSKKYVKSVTDFLSMGQEIEGKVIGTTKDGKLELSLRDSDTPIAVAAVEDSAATSAEGFEKKLTKFLKDSNKKISEYRNHLDKKNKARR